VREKFQQLLKKIIYINEKIETIATSNNTSKLRITLGVIWNLGLVFFIIFLIGSVFVFSIGLGYFASLVKDEPLYTKGEMRKLIYNYEETSEMYFAGNVYIGKIRTDLEREKTTLDQVSPILIKAVLATEDEYFYDHNGIVPKAVLRGLIQDFTNSSTQTGGSTLTQQLIKNQILTNEVSYERKARELLLALRLEHFMTKDEILEAYLNIIPYGRNSSGRNIAGVETAAKGIFGVSASELNLPQAAYIAGIPQAPFSYTPFTQKGQLKSEEGLQPGIERMKTVLYRMKQAGYITEAEYEEALEYDITKDFKEPESTTIKYPYLTFEIERRAKEIMARILAEKDGIDPKRLDEEENLYEKYIILADRDIRSGGYRIYTTIDKNLYDAMNNAAKEFKYYGHTFTKKVIDPETNQEMEVPDPVQVGSILIENKTGRILSFVGGRDFEITELNHATQAYRSNGSTMKPLLVYGPAIEYGLIGAGSPVVDVKFNYRGWKPKNYIPNEERGIIPAREALAYSQNLTAIRLYDQIIDRRPAELLAKMGFSKLTKGDFENLAAAIGAIDVGTTVEENTNAYATFANGGKFIDAYMIEKIEDVDGNVIYQHAAEPVQVYSPETSYIITDMMRDVFAYGTGAKARSSLKFSSDFAGKTGTSEKYRDVWLVGYNPNISLGVWLGYDKHRTLYQFNNVYFQPSVRINLLWATLMNAAYDAKPDLIASKERFQKPKDVVYASFCGISGMAPSKACSDAGLVRSDLFIRRFVPSAIDNSFVSSETRTVNINGETYLALDSTPQEFTYPASGISLNQDFISKMLGRLGGNPDKLLGESILKVTNTKTFTPDQAAPQPVSVTINGNVLSWSPSASNDVIGYRVYDLTGGSRKLIASVRSGENRSIAVGNGQFGVAAVDITGLESSVSMVQTDGTVEENPVDDETENHDQMPIDNGNENDDENNGNHPQINLPNNQRNQQNRQ